MKFKKKIKHFPKGFFSLFSIIATAGINYTIVHNGFIVIAIIVLLAHELGHFYVAKRHKGEPDFPWFIPLPFFAIAVTKVKKMNSEGTLNTSFYGPFTGFLTALGILFVSLLLNLEYIFSIIFLIIGEIFVNYFGSDGKKFRQAKKEIQTCLL